MKYKNLIVFSVYFLQEVVLRFLRKNALTGWIFLPTLQIPWFFPLVEVQGRWVLAYSVGELVTPSAVLIQDSFIPWLSASCKSGGKGGFSRIMHNFSSAV